MSNETKFIQDTEMIDMYLVIILAATADKFWNSSDYDNRNTMDQLIIMPC